MELKDFRLDLNDHRTSFIERVLIWIGVVCMVVGTVSEVVCAVQAWQVMQ